MVKVNVRIYVNIQVMKMLKTFKTQGKLPKIQILRI